MEAQNDAIHQLRKDNAFVVSGGAVLSPTSHGIIFVR